MEALKSAQTPVLFLVHGSSISSRPSFDLTVPGRTDGNSDIASGVEDLKAAVDVVVKETGQQKMHFFGESSGGLRAGAYAMAQPNRVDP